MTTTLAGRIPALRALFAAAVLAMGLVAGPAAAGEFTPRLGNYFNEGEPGWGLDVQRADPAQFGADNLIFVLWFTYREDGTPIWYLAVGELNGMSWSGTLDVFTWDRALLVATNETIGTISMAWSSESDATFSWDLDSVAGKGSVTGEREVSFAEFATGPTSVDYTGHHFPPGLPGWGMSILTLGHVSVGTMYFYDGDGQPTWVQGVDEDSDMLLSMDMQYFTADGLCPACLAKSGKGGSFENVDFATVAVSYQSRFLEEPARIDDVDHLFGVAYLASSVNPDPLGPQPFSFAVGSVAVHLFPGGTAYTVLRPLTPRPEYLSLSDDEVMDIVQLAEMKRDRGVSINPVLQLDCDSGVIETLELELDPDGYGPVLRNGTELFFQDELFIVWNIATRVAAFRSGDETLSLLFEGGLDQGLSTTFQTWIYTGSADEFFMDPSMFLMNQVVSTRANGIFSARPSIFASFYTGVTGFDCATATP